MALIGNDSRTLIDGLSTFWRRFFKDVTDLEASYEGTEILLGQVYLNILSDVLNTSVQETPLFRKEYYRLITAREDQIEYKERGPGIPLPVETFYATVIPTDRYVLKTETTFSGIPRLQDLVTAPTNALEEGADYRVIPQEIHFKDDPTGTPPPGFAQRRVTVAAGGRFSSASTDWVAAGVKKGDTLYYSEKVDLGTVPPTDQTSGAFAVWRDLQADARIAKIIHVTSDYLTVSVDTAFPLFPEGVVPTGFSWRVMRLRDDGTYNIALPRAPSVPVPFYDGQIERTTTLEVGEVAFWAVDAKVDDFTIYNNYGYFFTDKHVSTESYRALIRGLMQLYILGPVMARLESALNLIAGLPTTKNEEETLTLYDSGILGSGTTGSLQPGDIFESPVPVFTPASIGDFIKITASDTPSNIGLFNIQEVYDANRVRLGPVTILLPDATVSWTYTRNNKQFVYTDQNTYEFPLDTPIRDDLKEVSNFGTLKLQAFEALTTAMRVTDYIQDPEWWHNIVIPNKLMPNTPAYRRVVTQQLYPNTIGPAGGAYIGDPGFYIGADEDQRIVPAPYRHNAAFILMDRFMKMHMFAVLIDSSVGIDAALTKSIYDVISDVKPVHTLQYIDAPTTLYDVIDVTDDMLVASVLRTIEAIGQVDNTLRIGTTWNIGDTWAFSGPVGGALLLNGGAGYIYAAIGGHDPSIQPGDPLPGPATAVNMIDRPVHVYMHA